MKTAPRMFAPSVWKLAFALSLPAAASAAPLADAVTVSGFHFQPPAGYLKRNGPPPLPGSVLCAWIGAGRADGTHPTLEMMVAPIPAGRWAQATLPFLSANFLGGIRRTKTEWQATPPQVVLVHGLRFYRSYWMGKDIQTGCAMHGVQYVACDGGRVILFASQDPEQAGADGIALAQAAMLTVRRAQ